MIDVHCHLIPFLDDGAADWEVALSMARLAVEDGIVRSVATPHWTGAKGETEKTLGNLEELRQRLAAEGLPLKVDVGNEVILVPTLIEALKERRALTLSETNYILLETAQLEHGAYIHSALFHLQSSGYRIILAHPERVVTWQADLSDLRELVRRGCYIQVNAGSLMGDFGAGARRTAEQLVRRGWVSLLATDSHSVSQRPPSLSPAVERCARIIGEEAARVLVEDNPARVLCDDTLPYVETDTPERRPLFSLPSFQLPWTRKNRL